jgi:hypothetical protein
MFKKNDRVRLKNPERHPEAPNFRNGVILKMSKGIATVLLDDGKKIFKGSSALLEHSNEALPECLMPDFRVGDTVEFDVHGKLRRGIAVKVSRMSATVLAEGGSSSFENYPWLFRRSKTPIRPEENVGPIAEFSISGYRSIQGNDYPIIECKILRNGVPVIRAFDPGILCEFEFQPLTKNGKSHLDAFRSAAKIWAADAGAPDLEQPEEYWIDWMARFRKAGRTSKEHLSEALLEDVD